MPIYYPGIPGAQPGPVSAPRSPGVISTWEAWDGTIWDLTGRGGSIRLGADGLVGMEMPEWVDWVSESPSVDGDWWRGRHVKAREVLWPISIRSAYGASQEWLDVDRRFWDTMLPGRRGRWRVAQPNGTSRSLVLELRSGVDVRYSDGFTFGWNRYAIPLIARQPYWEGSPVTGGPWDNGADNAETFFGSGTGAPPWHIAQGVTLATATVTNPGDVESWPAWTINGPGTDIAITVSGNTIAVPFPLADGDTLVIDTHPTRQTATLNGTVDKTGDLTQAGFAPIPPGASVPVELSLTGPGSISLSMPTYYWRAW